MKSRKKPSKKITAITTINCVQKPPGKSCKKSLTNSSPPNALKADVNIAAPRRIINTIDVVTQVSVTTFFKTLSILKALQKLHPIANKNQKTKKAVANIAIKFLVLSIFLTFK